jgi:RNA polymerase sigma-70 factor (ECF subfamily)
MAVALANPQALRLMDAVSFREPVMSKAKGAADDLDRRLSQLMIAVQAGDRRAYGELLRDCEPLIRRASRRAGVSDDRIHDVVQETLLTLHNARQTYDPSRSFSAWIGTIAQRRAIDSLRKHGRTGRREVHAPLAYEDHADQSAAPSEGLEQDGRAKILREAIAHLPVGQREAVERLALREQSLSEASAETGKTAGALKVNLHRALKALRARLGGEDEHV